MSRQRPQRGSDEGAGDARIGLSAPIRAGAAAVLGLVFLLGLGTEAFALRSCPHHHPDRDDTRRPAAAAGLDRPASGSPGDRAAPPRCMCMGSCTTAASTALPALDAVAPVPAPGPVSVGALPADSRPRSPLSPYLLPYANGPPPARA